MFTGILYGLFFGLIVGFFTYWYFIVRNRQNKSTSITNTSIILDRIERVLKVVVAEGYFSEIIDYQHENKQIWGLISSTKKSLVLAKAKVIVGFDVRKCNPIIDVENQKIKFEKLPEPEILAIEPDYKFYDIENGWFNKFETDDYTKILENAKQEIANKAFDGELMLTAKKQLRLMLEQVAENTNFKLELANTHLLQNK